MTPWVSPPDGVVPPPASPAPGSPSRRTKYSLQLPVGLAMFFTKGIARAQFEPFTSRSAPGKFRSELSFKQALSIIKLVMKENEDRPASQ